MEEEEEGTDHAATLAAALNAYCPDNLRFAGGWGMTWQTAIRIEGASTPGQHASALHHLLSFLLGTRGADWNLQAVSLAAYDGGYFDCVRVSLEPNGGELMLFVRAFEKEPIPTVDGVLGSLVTNGGRQGTLSLNPEIKISPAMTYLHLMSHQGQVLIHDH
jgi:hypothetical protein